MSTSSTELVDIIPIADMDHLLLNQGFVPIGETATPLGDQIATISRLEIVPNYFFYTEHSHSFWQLEKLGIRSLCDNRVQLALIRDEYTTIVEVR